MRLTNSLKEAIVKAAIKQAGIPQERADLRKLTQQLAEDVRVDRLGGQEGLEAIAAAKLELARLSKKIPNVAMGGFAISHYASVSFGGKSTTLYYTDDHEDRINYKGRANYPADHPFSLRFDETVKIGKQIDDKADHVEAVVRGTLRTVNTVKQLLDAWPEAKELLPASKQPAPQLPAIRREDLNKIIGLPSDKEAA